MAENRSIVPTAITAVVAFIAGWIVLNLILKAVHTVVTLLILIGLLTVIGWALGRRRR
jgi:hypothetical protein